MSKNEWPELVGMTGTEAKEKILKEYPELTTWQEAQDRIRHEYPKISVQVLPEGSRVTMEMKEDRVRVFIDGDTKVTQPPKIG